MADYKEIGEFEFTVLKETDPIASDTLEQMQLAAKMTLEHPSVNYYFGQISPDIENTEKKVRVAGVSTLYNFDPCFGIRSEV